VLVPFRADELAPSAGGPALRVREQRAAVVHPDAQLGLAVAARRAGAARGVGALEHLFLPRVDVEEDVLPLAARTRAGQRTRGGGELRVSMCARSRAGGGDASRGCWAARARRRTRRLSRAGRWSA
jgi:hypothetical protein